MPGTRGGLGRIIAMGIGLGLVLLLLIVGEARAGRYVVAQCGWYVGADASWADTTGGAKFRPDAFCASPGGAHLKSFTRDGTTVSGNRFARWRWQTPAGTGITAVHGTWWHTLHDGFEQRLGSDIGNGSFAVFGAAAATDVAPHEFGAAFSPPVAAFEDRLLCARAESKWCSLAPGSWSALRDLSITVEDNSPPAAGFGGQLLDGGWRRDTQHFVFWGSELGGGIRFAETSLDGARIDLTEYGCAKAQIDGEWRATQMQPCPPGPSASGNVDTTRFSDGHHTVRHCATDFAGNVGCTPDYRIAVDNNPPGHPHSPHLAGGDGWRRSDDFDFTWANPDQGPASPVAGAFWRITRPVAGYDTGTHSIDGINATSLRDRKVPVPGRYLLRLWLRDEAGNADSSNAVEVPLRFDDVEPELAFSGAEGEESDELRAELRDAHSGGADGAIFYRELESKRWKELPTKATPSAEKAVTLSAHLPELPPGVYVFRAEGVDAAGNRTATSLRADGTRMTIRRAAPVILPPPPRAKSRLFARLRGGHGRGDSLTVHFGAPARLSGRLTRADGAGLGGRALRVVSRPSRGALAPVAVETMRTGARGGFELALGPGPSRRLSVHFGGDPGFDGSSRTSLALRVRGGISLRAKPRRLHTGQIVHLSGRVRSQGAPVPRRGKLVAIQYLESSTHRWRPVLVTRSDHHGRFRARYRFRYISGAARVRLRATALAEERWPYAPGFSRPLTVGVNAATAERRDDDR